MKLKAQICILILALSGMVLAQDTLGVHDLTPMGTSPLKGGLSASCLYCHAPHSGIGGNTPLWNQKLSTKTYTPYSSSTYVETGNQVPPVGGPSSLCLSCHDGTVAPGVTVAYGQITTTGSMNTADKFGTNLQGSHPFSLVLPLKDSPDLVATLVSNGTTTDPTGAVKLIGGNVECTSCHQPHVQNTDPVSENFLVRNGSNGQICLACHDPNRVVTGKVNPLAGWPTSIHATASNTVSNQPLLGSYQTVAQNACLSCHTPHNAGSTEELLRGPNEQDCISCHNGGSNVSPAVPKNVFAEYAKTYAHPFPSGANLHKAGEPAVLNNNRHATCADCHDAHAAQPVGSFPAPPTIRATQTGVVGVSATDGTTVLTPAVNQYENCLRCHGTSTGKVQNPAYGYMPTRLVSAADSLNVIPEFSVTATSSHPVMHDSNSPNSQSSLRTTMLELDGSTAGRAMGTRILCTDCHNSDDNDEFGGAGANGPHGSKYPHILERQYVMSQTTTAGAAITNLQLANQTSTTGPYALCAKCHDLTKVMTDSWVDASANNLHNSHVMTDGVSCSVCHTAHGIGATSANLSGNSLVDFDVNVVAPNNASTPISYNSTTNTCTLTCHGHVH